jgi:hypothetical protein
MESVKAHPVALTLLIVVVLILAALTFATFAPNTVGTR